MERRATINEVRNVLQQRLSRLPALADQKITMLLRALASEIANVCPGVKTKKENGTWELTLAVPETLPPHSSRAIGNQLAALKKIRRLDILKQLQSDPLLHVLSDIAERVPATAEETAPTAEERHKNFLHQMRQLQRHKNVPYGIYRALAALALVMGFTPEGIHIGSIIPASILARATSALRSVRAEDIDTFCTEYVRSPTIREFLQDIRSGRTERYTAPSYGEETLFEQYSSADVERFLHERIKGQEPGDRRIAAMLSPREITQLHINPADFAVPELLHACTELATSSTSEWRAALTELREAVALFPEELTPRLEEVRQRMLTLALKLYGHIERFPSFHPATEDAARLMAEPGESDRREIAQDVRCAWLAHEMVSTFVTQQQTEHRFPSLGAIRAAEHIVASSVAQSLLILMLHRHYPWMFSVSAEESSATLKQRKIFAEQKILWLHFCRDAASSAKQTVPNDPFEGLQRSFNDTVEEQVQGLSALLRLQQWAMTRAPATEGDRVRIPWPRTTPPARSTIVQRTKDAAGQHLLGSVTTYTPGFGPQVERSPRSDDMNEPATAWLWEPFGEPCHHERTIIPLRRILPGNANVVAFLDYLAHRSDGDLKSWLQACQDLGFDRSFPILTEERKELHFMGFVSELHGKRGESGSGFALPKETIDLLPPCPELADALPAADADREVHDVLTTLGIPCLPQGTLLIPYTSEVPDLNQDTEVPESEGERRKQASTLLRTYAPRKTLIPKDEALAILQGAGIYLNTEKGRSPHFHFVGPTGREVACPSQPLKEGQFFRQFIATVIAQTGDIDALAQWVESKRKRNGNNRTH